MLAGDVETGLGGKPNSFPFLLLAQPEGVRLSSSLNSDPVPSRGLRTSTKSDGIISPKWVTVKPLARKPECAGLNPALGTFFRVGG